MRSFLFLDKTNFLSGHTDGILQINGVRKVLELKTCNSKSFKYLVGFRKAANENHVAQTQIYMHEFNVKAGLVVYINKDDSTWAQFPLVYSEAAVQKLISKPVQIRNGILSRTPPKREKCEKIDCYRAQSCPMAKRCFELT